jgi:hypothetical protein
MFSFQKRGNTTITSGLETGAEAAGDDHATGHGASPSELHMPVDHGSHDQEETSTHPPEAYPTSLSGNDSAVGEQGTPADHYAAAAQPPPSSFSAHETYGSDAPNMADYAAGQQDPSAVDTNSYPSYNPKSARAPSSAAQRGNGETGDQADVMGEEEVDDMDHEQLFTDYHGSADRAAAHSRRLQQQKMYDDIPMPPDDADPHTVFAYYRKLIGLVQLVPPKHWREIRFDLPANVAELRLYPQRRERIQDREPIRPSSTVVISLEGTLPENTTPSEYAAQMVQYFLDLLQYQNASSAITALRFVKRGTELSQMVVTLGKDSRLAGRVLTELQAAGLRAHYGMIIFEHPPNATFQVVDYRRTLHDGKGISAEDVAYLLEPMRLTKTVDINVIEGFEPGVFYVPVKRPETVYAFLWNYFCSYKFQFDLFRRYGVLVTQANCPHEFLKKGVPYYVQKRELEEKIKAELLQKGLEEREGMTEGTTKAGADEGDDSDVDEEALASGEGPAPAWVSAAADEIDIFSGLTKNTSKTALSALLSSKAGKSLTTDARATGGGDDGFAGKPYAATSAAPTIATAAATALADDVDGITNIDALLKQYNAVAAPTKKNDAAGRGRRDRESAGEGTAAPVATPSLLPPPPPLPGPPQMLMSGTPPLSLGNEYGWADPRQPQAPPHDTRNNSGAAPGGYLPYPGRPDMYPPPPQQQQQPPYYLQPPPPPLPQPLYADPYDYGAYPAPSTVNTPFAKVMGDTAAAPPPPPTSYPPLVEESEDDDYDEERVAQSKTQQQQAQQQSSSPLPSTREKEDLLSWSMAASQTNSRSDRRDDWRSVYNPLRDKDKNNDNNDRHPAFHHSEGSFVPASPVAADASAETIVKEDGSGGGGGVGILGDYDPSFDTPFYGDAGVGGYAAPPLQQGWGVPEATMAPMGGVYEGGNAYAYGGTFYDNNGQGWNPEGFPMPQLGSGAYDGYDPSLQQQQQQMMMMMNVPPPPHVVEAAQITEDLEERVQAAFPASWAAATAATAAPLPLDGEPELEAREAAAAAQRTSDCVVSHVAAGVAAAELPQPSTEMEELFDFLHRNVSVIGRLLHKTTTTTVEQANDVAPFRARVARALLIGVTAHTDAAAWAAAWVPQRADGQTTAATVAPPSADDAGHDKAAEPHNAEQPESKEPTHEGEGEEEEVVVEYQLPALLPYLLRMPAGMDLAMLLALHFPCAFAHRLLPYAPACLMEEQVVRQVLSTVLRRDPRAGAPLVRHLLAHWSPLLRWLQEYVDVKARGTDGAVAATSDSGEGTSSAATTNASVVKQLVSLLGNTMDLALAGLSPEQREACHACSVEHDYVQVFVASLKHAPATTDQEVVLPELWGLDGALYRSLLRLYLGADVCDGAALATRVLAGPSTAAGASSTTTQCVCLPRDRFYYALTVLSRSQTAPSLSRETAAFCGTFLQLVELQQAQGVQGTGDDSHPGATTSNNNTVGDSEAMQLLEMALKSLQTTEAYTALRAAYLNVRSGVPITRIERVLARLSSADPPAEVSLHGSNYREWYVSTKQAQKRNAESAKVSSIFYYQPPSRRSHGGSGNSGSSGGAVNARWGRHPQLSNNTTKDANSFPNAGDDGTTQQQQQPAWASAAAQWASEPGSGGVLSQRGTAGRGVIVSTAAQQWRMEWTETMRSYPATGTPFENTLPAGWTSGLSRSRGRYYFSKLPEGETPTTADSREAAAATGGEGETPSSAPPSPTPVNAAQTYRHPVDSKEYLVTPQAFLQEPGASAEVTAMQVCERANTLHREEAIASGLPPPAELTQADVETWLADQRRRNVFLDVATMDLLQVRYRNHGSGPAAAAVGVKRGRDTPVVPSLTPEEQQELLPKMITSAYPAVGAPYPALFHGWSVYYNSARGQYGFAGPHHGPSQPPLFIHPATRKHYFIAPQAFVRQRKVNYDVIAREANVEKAEVLRWMEDQRTRHAAIDAAVMKVIPIHYADIEKSLADNAAAAAAAAPAKGAEEDKKDTANSSGSNKAVTVAGGAEAPPSSSSKAPHRSDKSSSGGGGGGSSRKEERQGSRGRHQQRRRRRGDSVDYYSDEDSYSDRYSDDDYGRRRGNRRGRSPHRRSHRGGRRRR